MNNLVARRPPEDPFIFVPEIDRRYDKSDKFPSSQPINTTQQLPQYIPLPYPVPSFNNNQGNNQGGFNLGRALGAAAGYMGMAFGDPAFSPGLKLTPELAGRYGGIGDLLYRPDQDYGGIADFLYRPGQDKVEVQLLGQMPRRLQGNYRPAGVFGSPPPNIDSPFMDERIKRGFVPMTPPPSRGGGPQLPGFV